MVRLFSVLPYILLAACVIAASALNDPIWLGSSLVLCMIDIAYNINRIRERGMRINFNLEDLDDGDSLESETEEAMDMQKLNGGIL